MIAALPPTENCWPYINKRHGADTMDQTSNRLQQAKDALIHALQAAQKKAKPADIRKLETIIGKTEALQHSMRKSGSRKST
jgi:hypothetical protein